MRFVWGCPARRTEAWRARVGSPPASPAYKQRGGMKQNADDATNERPVVDALGQAGGVCRVERGGSCVLVEIRERIAGRAPGKQALIFVGERNRVRARFAAFFFNPDECAHRVELVLDRFDHRQIIRVNGSARRCD
jgi:hypothetical protein